MVHKLKEVITIQEAMDNLAVIGEMNLDQPPLLGVVQDVRLVTNESELSGGAVRWLSEEGERPILEILDRTYRTIHRHLQSLMANPETNWESKKLETGIAAMMALVGESAVKLDRYLAFRQGIAVEKREQRVSDREEFRSLQKFYVDEFSKKFADQIAGDEAWSKEWEDNEKNLPSAMSGLKDFETVKRDEEYELFYIRNEEGEPYFTSELLRNIKLTTDLVLSHEGFEEDPLLKVRAILDRDLQASANQILGECGTLIEEFYRKSEKWIENQLGRHLSLAIFALFLAANPRNLLQNTNGKSSLQYFSDFLSFYRAGLQTDEYKRWIAYPPEKNDHLASLLLSLAHHLAFAFFSRPGGVRQESIGLIHRTIRKGNEVLQASKKMPAKGNTVWNELLAIDEGLRSFLAKFPNGPLFKILDLIREEEGENQAIAFDPIGHGNYPYRLYQMQWKKKEIQVLHLPSPVRQEQISKCEITEEFQGFLRFCSEKKKKHLCINLNDRTSWREFGRSKALETLQKKAEHSKTFFVLTIPKTTDFYYQNNEYINLSRAEDFLAALQAQLQTPEECGFHFPTTWKTKELATFVEVCIPLIHTHFFESKPTLSRRNREDFLEIFYQFLILKTIEIDPPDSISFTSKDAIDLGSTSSASFYAFIKLLNGDFSKKEERDFLLWLFYSPALLIRERAIALDPLNRSLSFLEKVDGELAKKEDAILKDFGKLFEPQFLRQIKVIHS